MSPLGDKAHHPLFAATPSPSFFVSPDFNLHCSFVSPLFVYLSFSSPWYLPSVSSTTSLSSPATMHFHFIHPLISSNLPSSIWFPPLSLGNMSNIFHIYIQHIFVTQQFPYLCFWGRKTYYWWYFIFPFFNSFFLLMFSLFSCTPSSSLSFLWRSITSHHLDPPFFSLHLSFVYLLIPVSASWGQSEDVCAWQKKMMSSLSAPAGRTGAITQLRYCGLHDAASFQDRQPQLHRAADTACATTAAHIWGILVWL